MIDRPIEELLTDALDDYQAQVDAVGSTVRRPQQADTRLPEELRARAERGKACIDLLVALRNEDQANQLSPKPSLLVTATANRSASPARTIGRFQVREQLGTGGFGIVYRAYDPHTHRDVAVKIPRFEALSSSELTRRFEQEAQAAAKLDHSSVVSVLEAGVDGLLPYIASNYYPGATLADWLKEHRSSMAPREAAALVAALADGVAHAHSRGVLHRDLKPSNVLLVPIDAADGQKTVERTSDAKMASDQRVDVSRLQPKILDFGLAKLTDSADTMTRTGVLMGTIRYMSPEQAAGDSKRVGQASDIYSLGAILYELLAGEPPFAAEADLVVLRQIETVEPSRIRTKRKQTPADLETICLKCLEKAPDHRYPTAADLARDLRRFLAGEPIAARPATTVERAWKWCRRNPRWAAMVGVVFASLLGSVTVLAYSNWRTSTALFSERAARQQLETQLYAVDLRAAGEAVRRHDPVQAAQLLEKYTNPDPGSDLREFAWHYLRNLNAEHRLALPRHPADVYSLSLSQDGQRIATGCRDGVVRVWRKVGRQLEQQFAFPNTEVNEVAISPDGQWLASAAENGQVRIWDTDTWQQKGLFTIGGLITTDIRGHDSLGAVAVEPNGFIVVVGHFKRSVHAGFNFLAVRYRPDGNMDSNFMDGLANNCPGNSLGDDYATAVLRQPDGRIVVAGWSGEHDTADIVVQRLDAMGAADPTFGDQGVVRTDLGGRDVATGAVLQPEGGVVVAGYTRRESDTNDVALVRYHFDGRLDPTFGDQGRAITAVGGSDDRAHAIALQPDGKFVIAGVTLGLSGSDHRKLLVARYLADGSLDSSFGEGGLVATLVPRESDGRPIDCVANAVSLQSDGKILVAGSADSGSDRDFLLARYHPDGSLDASFSGDGILIAPQSELDSLANQVVALPDGTVLAAGVASVAGGRQFALARFLTDGTPDKGFGQHGQVQLSFGPGDAEITALAIDADGKIVAAGSARDGHDQADSQNLAVARLLPDGALDPTFSSNGAGGVRFAPDSQSLFAYADQMLYEYDLASTEPKSRILVPEFEIRDFEISSDGHRLAVATHRSAYFWNRSDLRAPHTIMPRAIHSVCLLRDGRRVVEGRGDGAMRVLDLETDDLLHNLHKPHQNSVAVQRLSPDGQLLASANSNVIVLHRTSDWRKLAEFSNAGGRVWDLEFTPDSRTLLSSDADGQMVEWPLLASTLPVLAEGGRELYVAPERITAIAHFADRQRILVGESNGDLKAIDVHTGECLAEFHGRQAAIRAITPGPSTGTFTVVSADGRAEVVDLDRNFRQERWSTGRPVSVAAMAPSGDQVALACADEPRIVLIDAADGRRQAQINGPQHVNRLLYSPSGRELLVAQAAGLAVYRADNGHTLAQVGRLGEAFHDVSFLADGRLLVAEGHRGLTLREFPSCRVIARFHGTETGFIGSVNISPNGRNLAISGDSGSVSVWDLLTMQPVLSLPNHAILPIPGGLQFSTDGSTLVGACFDTETADRIVVWWAN